jgi:hypothetical protein
LAEVSRVLRQQVVYGNHDEAFYVRSVQISTSFGETYLCVIMRVQEKNYNIKMEQNILIQTQLSYISLVLAISFGLGRPLSGQNIYKNVNASVYKVLFVNVMGSHLQSCRFFIINT